MNHHTTTPNSNMLCLQTNKMHFTEKEECAICYKVINKTYFKCGTPCSKLFHLACIEQMFDQIKNAALLYQQKPNYRCCYCRRAISLKNYRLQLLKQHLMNLHAYTYDVRSAVKQIDSILRTNTNNNNNNQQLQHYHQLEHDEHDEHDDLYIYELYNISYIQKPKQTKRLILKQPNHTPPLIRLKHHHRDHQHRH
jgi:hypothetical protein